MFIPGILRWCVAKQGILELETEKNGISWKGRVGIVLEIRKEKEAAAGSGYKTGHENGGGRSSGQ